MSSIGGYFDSLSELLGQIDTPAVDHIIDILWDCYRRGGRLVLCGNGGSASTASHIVADLQKNLFLIAGKKQWEVIALCDSMPLLTAWGNDTDYANVFAGQARCWLRPSDVLLAISGSGNSPNILAAIEAAKELGAVTIGLCGCGGGQLARAARHAVVVPSDNMQLVEDMHLSLLHAVYRELVERIGAISDSS